MLPPARAGGAVAAALLGDVVDWTVVAIGAAMIGLVFSNVLLHVVGKDLAAVTELAELLMVWVTFLGGACATRRGAQMTITEFIDMTRGGVRGAADAAVDVLTIVVLGLLVWYGVNLAIDRLGQRTHGAAGCRCRSSTWACRSAARDARVGAVGPRRASCAATRASSGWGRPDGGS